LLAFKCCNSQESVDRPLGSIGELCNKKKKSLGLLKQRRGKKQKKKSLKFCKRDTVCESEISEVGAGIKSIEKTAGEIKKSQRQDEIVALFSGLSCEDVLHISHLIAVCFGPRRQALSARSV
jgi:hypothetical protein